ncbi:MAG: type II toxin-antitoxin system VapC family toxin [Anaerolineales bacterium]|nr:type II toxin-antitoxin system VapC family toxin [Anaerolineales bacterium]
MIPYADTSALVKRYIREAKTEEVLTYFEQFPHIATASLTKVEIAAAMTKAMRQGWVDESAIQEAWQDFQEHWEAYLRLPISSGVIENATCRSWKHGLRAYDSLHLACASLWRELNAQQTIFVCFDKRLLLAAAAEGLPVWPPIEA